MQDPYFTSRGIILQNYINARPDWSDLETPNRDVLGMLSGGFGKQSRNWFGKMSPISWSTTPNALDFASDENILKVSENPPKLVLVDF